jgi:hypothetical protein
MIPTWNKTKRYRLGEFKSKADKKDPGHYRDTFYYRDTLPISPIPNSSCSASAALGLRPG